MKDGNGGLVLLGAGVFLGWLLFGRRRSGPPAYPLLGAPAKSIGQSTKKAMAAIVVCTLVLSVMLSTVAGAAKSGKPPKAMTEGAIKSAGLLGGLFAMTGAPKLPQFKLPQPSESESGNVCPVDGKARFSDTWGAYRSGGRSHKGVDLMAASGTRLVAVKDAWVIRAGWNRLGGLGVTLRDSRGTEFYYAHNSHNAVRRGDPVKRGQLIGRVGRTGNAWKGGRGAPHVHFEVRPHGRAVNPTGYVRAWCR